MSDTIRSVPAYICGVLLAAHFLRAGSLLLTFVCLVLPFTMLSRRVWSLYATRGMLGLGVLVWLGTMAARVMSRLEYGQPFLRLASILGAVTAFNALALALLLPRSVRERFK